MYLLSRKHIRGYNEALESGGIGASGVLTKLRRISLAVQCFQFDQEDVESEVEIGGKALLVRGMIENVCASLKKEKMSTQKKRLSQKLPNLSDTTKFLTSQEIDAEFESTVSQARKGIASVDSLHTAMIIVAGRIMLR